MLVIERLLQSAASAIWDVGSELLYIISRMNSSFEPGSFGAILPHGLADSMLMTFCSCPGHRGDEGHPVVPV